MICEDFHAQICLNEAMDALNCDHFDWRYKIKRIEQEKADYIDAFEDVRSRIDWSVVDQFNDMLAQLPKED